MEKLYCKICGLEINEKNYYLNENSMIDKNKNSDIKYCPFCGVDSKYLGSKEEIFKIDETLDEGTIKIFEKAMKLEVFNCEFYKEAASMAKRTEIKNKFSDLSRIEFMHARIHQKLGGFDKLPVLKKIDYEKYNDESILLEQANIRERHAVEFYNKNILKINSSNIKLIFKALSQVEADHIAITE
ncbi:ferritin family protein [Clostridium sediminicola]|uniref:ferritin family protein n=1 Tax=Clostridium sediminicola TaxID=3114879 RepID=UPI0031F1F29C